MNGVRSTFMRRGYLLTALSALLLLAASVGTAEAQRVSVGFVETSGEVSEKAFLDVNSLEAPQQVTVRVQGLAAGSRRGGDITASLGGNITITPSKPVYIGRVTPTGYNNGASPNASPAVPATLANATTAFAISSSHFTHSDEVVLVVAQSQTGSPDGNWLEETVELRLRVGTYTPDGGSETEASGSVSPDVFALTVNESHVAPVAKFQQPDFTLSEQSTRVVSADISSGIQGLPLPGDGTNFAGMANAFPGTLSVRVGNHQLVTLGACPTRGDGTGQYNRKLFRIGFDGSSPTDAVDWAQTNFTNTGVLTTVATIQALAEGGTTDDTASADMIIEGCGDGAGIRDPYITLTVMSSGLSGYTRAGPTYGSIETGPPLMVSIDSDEAAPTLSFSPTDVTIDEGSSVETVLLAEGPNANDVRTVKLMVEGDAMVDLYQGDEMLEEMNGYVMVDLGGNSSARLTAMSMESRELQDGDMAYKAWKLMDGAAEGVNIGDDYWFRVDVVGMTAVPALPLIGQLLLALFLMAGGSRLYRRRRG